jgi:hypothetical protein
VNRIAAATIGDKIKRPRAAFNAARMGIPIPARNMIAA